MPGMTILTRKVLEYLARLQQQNALLEETLTLSQKNNALQRELTARLPASLHGHHYGPTLQAFRNYLTDRLVDIRLFPGLDEIIDKVSSLVVVRPAKSQRMRLCQCPGLVIVTSAPGLSAGLLELPLFFPRASPDNALFPPHSRWRAVADDWYDQDGHLHTISEWEYKRRLSMYFQSLLEFLYPEYFGPTIPAGGGWHSVAILESSQNSGPPEKHWLVAMASPANATPAQRANGKAC